MAKTIKENWYIGLIFIIGTLLRFVNLGSFNLYIDEVLFTEFLKNPPMQEHLPWLIGHIFNGNDFWLRFPFALMGSISIVIPFFIFNKKNATYIALFIAVCPLFVFYSRVARPYIFALPFVMLGFKYWWMQIPALLTTPFAITGLDFNLIREKFFGVIIVVIFIISAMILFSIRPDIGDKNFFNIDFIMNAKRLWIIPITGLIFNIVKYLEKK